MHPPNYVEAQICPVIKSNDMTKEIVWTYLVTGKYENDRQGLAEKLCGERKTVPDDSRIRIEARLHPGTEDWVRVQTTLINRLKN